MEKLNAIELDVANEIVNIGLAKSADSLSFFIGEKVLLKSCDLEIKEVSDNHKVLPVNDEAKYILTTEIIGEMEGTSFLVLTQNEADKLLKLSITPEIKEDPVQLEEMTNGMLLEVDNIITASVLTQFSNLLDIRMFGGVPALSIKTKEDIDRQIMEGMKGKQFILSFKANFDSDDANFTPEFVWLLNTRFIEGVKGLVKEDPSLEKLEELKEGSNS